ncbi:MAG: hypothetical protein QNK11_10135 [Legionella sp.]|nr:hypothetical protein [Legionella sp.]
MPSELLNQQAEAEAIYMAALIRLATEKALEKAREGAHLNFDPQGRVLLDITPTLDDISDIIQNINREQNPTPPFEATKAGLEKALGRKNTNATTVSLDITEHPTLKSNFTQKLTDALISNAHVAAEKSEKIITALNQQPKGSMIALQQEFHMHLALTGRLYEKYNPALTNKMPEIHEKAMHKVNALIMTEYAKALNAAYDGKNINIAILNNLLDKARETITPLAHRILSETVAEKTEYILSREDIETAENLKHSAESTTATSNDFLHTDSKQATLIEGSDETAHKRKEGTEFAHRQIITCNISKNGRVIALSHPRIQIRTPSPVVKKGLNNEEEYALDTAKKLHYIEERYDLRNRLDADKNQIRSRAFIYNSYTAINDRLDDLSGKNHQTQSAGHILLGAHAYNKTQIENHPDNPVFCFVQNISVNGFGDTLGYDNKDSWVQESTLMAEMALAHTLYDPSDEISSRSFETAIDAYKQYLNDPKDKLFSESDSGEKAILALTTLKVHYASLTPETQQSPIETAKSALRKLMASDLHCDHNYAKLIQSLSVYIEEASIGGCKSGNERAQAINGRVAVFDRALEIQESDVFEQMQALATSSPDNIEQHAGTLKTAVDTEYNKTGLQGALSIISLLDQGAAAKVLAKVKSFFGTFNRNYAEEFSDVMTNLFQFNAGEMQAHKNLTEEMMSASGIHKSFGERIKALSLPEKIAAIITILPTVVIAITGALDDQKRDVIALALETKVQKYKQAQQQKSKPADSFVPNQLPTHDHLKTVRKKISSQSQRKEASKNRGRAPSNKR